MKLFPTVLSLFCPPETELETQLPRFPAHFLLALGSQAPTWGGRNKLTNKLMSHFSTIKTQLKEKKPLIKALNQLGYDINQEEKFVKGYKGQFTSVDISMNLFFEATRQS